ncbi:putative protein kinase [Trypanosoma vivax]|uniref:non-specific serine/threonine protein kinase n=1 Tax=Trypanosoma vivax (strain Y486) TaxID=1055687 RepID=G0TR55_TRYVY|nr:putative protein kinase [Trypanosoma vivax]KAH8611125.1 putative protein kinase [Trypanosoma vivax]CCC46419.1 putative protein kinase [Trypanosoma vivax Y486]
MSLDIRDAGSISGNNSYLEERGITELMSNLSREVEEQKPQKPLEYIIERLASLVTTTEQINPAHRHIGTSGDGDGGEVEEGHSIPEFAVFAPVNELTPNINCSENSRSCRVDPSAVTPTTATAGNNNVSSALTVFEFPDSSQTPASVTGVARASGLSLESGALLMRTPPVLAPRDGGKLPAFPPARSPGNVPIAKEMLPSTKKLMSAIQELAPSEHTAAIAFLEGLKGKKTLSTPTVNITPNMDMSSGTTVNRESQGPSLTEEAVLTPPSTFFSECVGNTSDLKVTSIRLRNLASDALTTSIIAREDVEKDRGKLAWPTVTHVHVDTTGCKWGGRSSLAAMSSQWGHRFSSEQSNTASTPSSAFAQFPLDVNFDEDGMFASYFDQSCLDPLGLRHQSDKGKTLPAILGKGDREFQVGFTSSSDDELRGAREALASCEHFYGCSESEIEVYARSMQRTILSPGQRLKAGGMIVFVYSGVLNVEQGGVVVGPLHPGAILCALRCSRGDESHDLDELVAVSQAMALTLRGDNLHYLQMNIKYAKRTMFLSIMKLSPLFSWITSRECKHIADMMHVWTMKAGTVIMSRGQRVGWFVMMLNGTARRIMPDETDSDEASPSKTQEETASPAVGVRSTLELNVGSDVGLLELFFELPLLTDIVAVTSVAVARIHSLYFHSFVGQKVADNMKYAVAKGALFTPLDSLIPGDVRQKMIQIVESCRKPLRTRAGTHEYKPDVSPMVFSSTITSPTVSRGKAHNFDRTPRQPKCKRICSSGEIIYAGKTDHYRFPLSALGLSNTVMIAVVLDGVIIRWNEVAEQTTGLRQCDVVGQSIFSILATEPARRCLREQLMLGRKYAGKWNEYVAGGLSSPQAFRFRQASKLYHVNLLLSVIPSCLKSTEEVLLLVGREMDSNTMAHYVEDTARWLNEVLRPQLGAFQKRVNELKAKNWRMSAEDGETLSGHVEACNQLMERYLRLTSLNMESMDTQWKPVRLRNVIRQFSREVIQQVQKSGNTISTDVDSSVTKGELFMDVEHVLEVFRWLVSDANSAGPGLHIRIAVGAVQPEMNQSNSLDRKDGAHLFGSTPIHAGAVFPSARSVSSYSPPASGNGSGFGNGNDNVRLCPIQPHRQVIGSGSQVCARRIRIDVSVGAKNHDSRASLTEPGGSNEEGSPCKSCSTGDAEGGRRLKLIKNCKELVDAMGGTFVLRGTSNGGVGHNIVIELPLLPAPWDENDEDDSEAPSSIGGRPLTVIIADRETKQRNRLCQLMWTRKHAVVPVTSLLEVTKKIDSDSIDVLVIDPSHLDAAGGEYGMDEEASLFCVLKDHRLVVVLYTEDFSDWRAQKLMECSHVIELPKPVSGALFHVAMYEAERLVTRMREDEENIAQIRSTFVELRPERYSLGPVLGKGAFGEVHEVVDLLTEGKLAMKRMRLRDGVLADDVLRELLAVMSLRHENIIHYFHCERESETSLRLYMELASCGTLQDKIRKHGKPLPLNTIVQHLEDLCRGLAYIHSKSYVHGDIKTANALIDKYGRTKIGDFGTAKQLKRRSEKLYGVVGTPQFMAPEVMSADASLKLGYDEKADIWSIGCVALELATGQPPFSHLVEAQGMRIFYYVSHLEGTPDLSLIENGDPTLYTFVKSCLSVDPDKRPTAKELLLHDLLHGLGSTSRKTLLARRVEIVEKLRMYAAISQDSEEDEEMDVYDVNMGENVINGFDENSSDHESLSNDSDEWERQSFRLDVESYSVSSGSNGVPDASEVHNSFLGATASDAFMQSMRRAGLYSTAEDIFFSSSSSHENSVSERLQRNKAP